MVAISRNSCRICYSATTPNTEHLMATRSFAIPSLHIDSASWADLLQHEKTLDEMQQMVTGYLAYGRSMDWTLDAEYDGDVDLPRPLSWTLEQWRNIYLTAVNSRIQHSDIVMPKVHETDNGFGTWWNTCPHCCNWGHADVNVCRSVVVFSDFIE